MKKLYIVTGAYGFLGNTVIRQLLDRGETVRGLVLPNDKAIDFQNNNVQIYYGDVCDLDSLDEIFKTDEACDKYVIHTAGIVSIASRYNELVYNVNVNGTNNIIKMCIKYGVRRLIHVSSVHAIPEENEIIEEVKEFNPDLVIGLYAKTKAEATRNVLAAVDKGLDAVVVHPSGIIGPGDFGHSHLSQLVVDYIRGRLTACVNGGYDFVDVRDVANGIVSALDRGKKGECYILSNRYYAVKDILDMLHEITGKRQIKTVLPMWFAKITAPLSEIYYKLLKQPPLYTSYSLYTLKSNSNFSHGKADRELGYKTRDMYETLKETVEFINKRNMK